MTDRSKFSDQNLEALELLEFIDPTRLSKGLRRILLDYLHQGYDHLSHDFKDFAEDLNFLFEFLDALGDERT